MTHPQLFDPASIRAVAFDAYGTLFDIEALSATWYGRELLAQWGQEDADHEAFEQSVKAAWFRVGPWAEHAGPDGAGDQEVLFRGPMGEWISTWGIWRRQYELALDEHGLEGDPREAGDHLRTVLSRVPAYPDARPAIERLASHGLLVGLLSNADDDFLQRCISRAGLRFSVIQSSESLRVYKPHETAFLTMCERLGCDPPEVLYVGYSPETDIAGAANAGMRTAWVREDDTEYPIDLHPPDIEASSLSAVADAVRAL